MINKKQNFVDACREDPSLVFKMISLGNYDVVETLINDNAINVNMVDSVGNDVVMRLLKAKQYDLVYQLMKKKNWDVNHKNNEGDTFGHILAHDDSLCAVKVVEQLSKKKNYLPNIRNNKGETIFDRALRHNYLCTALKVLEDKRFNSIDIDSFKNLCNRFIKNRDYGKYTKINTLEIIVENFEKKDLEPKIANLVEEISLNMDKLKNDIMNNDSKLLDSLLDNYS